MGNVKFPEPALKDLFDTHAHLYDDRYLSEGISPEDILLRASENGVKRILIPADSIETSKKAIDFVKRYDGSEGVELFCSVGVHPHEASSYSEEGEEQLREWLLAREELKICALGEIGLDHHYDLSPRDVQHKVYERQLELAFEYDIPIILHEREATGESMYLLRSFHNSGKMRKSPGVCHCCGCSPEIALELVKMGFYIGVDGPLTFKNNKNTPAVCRAVPLDRLVVETDSPYLTPEPNRGRINEPAMVSWVVKKVAEIKEISVEEASAALTRNGLALYEIS